MAPPLYAAAPGDRVSTQDRAASTATVIPPECDLG